VNPIIRGKLAPLAFSSVMPLASIRAVPNTLGLYQIIPRISGIKAATTIAIKFISITNIFSYKKIMQLVMNLINQVKKSCLKRRVN